MKGWKMALALGAATRLRELWPESTFTALRLHSKSTKQRRSTRRITVPPARPGHAGGGQGMAERAAP